MKNAVIVILASLCGYLALHGLGVFNFGSGIDREHRDHYEAQRTKAVNAASAYIMGVVYNDEDPVDKDTLQGIKLALEMVNARAPDKPLKLLTSVAQSKILYNEAIQAFAEDPNTALAIGPFDSTHIPSARALTQFYGLPLVSPSTVVSEKLPPLEPDNFVTLFPPLAQWAKAVLDHMERNKVKNLCILSSGKGTYSDIFCTALERESHNRQSFEQIFRINYQAPLRRQDIERTVRNHAQDQKFDAIFFGGTMLDFPECMELLKENSISLPLYGSDDLLPGIASLPRAFDLYLPLAVWKGPGSEFTTQWQQRHGAKPDYNILFGAETVFALADLLGEKGYSARELPELLRKHVHKRMGNPDTAPQVILQAFPPNESVTP